MWRLEAEAIFRRERVSPTEDRAESIIGAFMWGQSERIEWRLYLAAELLMAVRRLDTADHAKDHNLSILRAIFAAERHRDLLAFLDWEKRNNPGVIATAARMNRMQARITALRVALNSGAVAGNTAAVLKWRRQDGLAGKEREAARRAAHRDLKAARSLAK